MKTNKRLIEAGVTPEMVVESFKDVKRTAKLKFIEKLNSTKEHGNYKKFTREQARKVLKTYLECKFKENNISLDFNLRNQDLYFSSSTPLKELQSKVEEFYKLKRALQFVNNVKQKFHDLELGDYDISIANCRIDRCIHDDKIVLHLGTGVMNYNGFNIWLAKTEQTLICSLEQEIKNRCELVELSENFWKCSELNQGGSNEKNI